MEASDPSFVLILTDDQELTSTRYMPRLQELLVDRGVSFSNAFVTNPVCCPSRTSILRGQYSHNHGVWTNNGPDGGFAAFQEHGNGRSNIATWLSDRGYRTMLVGKFLNGYAEPYIPPGWEEWYGKYQDGLYYRFILNENGVARYYSGRYETDVIRDRTIEFIWRAAQEKRPFFAYVAPIAPHIPATPAARHLGAYSHLRAPRPPSFNENEVGDKPSHIQALSPLDALSVSEIDDLYQRRMESLLAVDELIADVIEMLAETQRLDNTYVIFTSDNGYHLGQHRLAPGKSTPYEEDIHVPLIIRGPGIPAGAIRDELVLNIDLAPTFAELAGASVPSFVDGRSLVPLFTAPSADWRQVFLVEQRWFRAVRTADHKYVRYASGDRELYDLSTDPYELENLAGAPSMSALRDSLAGILGALAVCSGAQCRALD